MQNAVVQSTRSIDARILLALQLAAFWPVWCWYIQRMFDRSDEPWGVVALVTALGFVFLQPLSKATPKVWPCFGVVLSGTIYVVFYSALPALVKGVLAMSSLLCTFLYLGLPLSFGLGIGGLLILSLPMIASLQFYLGYPLRLVTTHLVAELLSLLGMIVESSGTLLLWRGETLSVDAPCSGIRMLWTGLYLSFSLSCFFRLGNFLTWVSYSIACALVFIGNFVRTFLVFLLEMGVIRVPFDVHALTGLLAFVVVAFVIVLVQLKFMRRAQCGFT